MTDRVPAALPDPVPEPRLPSWIGRWVRDTVVRPVRATTRAVLASLGLRRV